MESTSARRIGQLIRMLSSDQPGEVGAAAQALNRTLVSAGLDIHRLADVVEKQLASPQPKVKSATAGEYSPAQRTRRPAPSHPCRPGGRPLQMGNHVICDERHGVFRRCLCGSTRFTVCKGVGPHVAQLVCDRCRRGGRWLAMHHFGGAA
jgi:hypothetical protein